MKKYGSNKIVIYRLMKGYFKEHTSALNTVLLLLLLLLKYFVYYKYFDFYVVSPQSEFILLHIGIYQPSINITILLI